MQFRSLKGIQDILPPESYVWQKIEETSRETFKKYGYHEIRLPIIESTELFTRSIGETSDIVEKEMYTFNDKGDRSVTLRPEGTASLVRAYVEHHLYNEPSPQKYYYIGPMFRYERPQAGRFRQFHQIGAEVLGSEDPSLDAEIVSMLNAILRRLGIDGFDIEITSIGCKTCRPDFKTELKKSLADRLGLFCEDCNRRFDLNPLRTLDCKVPSCIEARKGSPAIIDFLCGECSRHMNGLKHGLSLLNIPFVINPNMVRGLDYYTRTAFEVTQGSPGSQKAIAAGGRYDGLVAEFGGPPIPGIGFAIGAERIVPLIKESLTVRESPDLFFCTLGKEASEKSFVLTSQLREKGLWVEMNYDTSSLKSQMRKADRLGAKNVIVLGEDELKNGRATIKNMKDKNEIAVAFDAGDILKAISK
ncbi:MAG: histidine--tRNA ligase [Nitrospirae bacterium]|nr:histidine--tRNA ligase [Nitrospirota bacterium]